MSTLRPTPAARLFAHALLPALALAVSACASPEPSGSARWTLAADSPVAVEDVALLSRMAAALDAAETAGTDPNISGHHVRAATVVNAGGRDEVVVGGNTEYGVPQAVHGEVSVMNHVTARFGAEIARREVKFIAFFGQSCGDSRGCGDCRDYMRATTEHQSLLWVCGRATDRTIHVRRFSDGLREESDLPDADEASLGLPAADVRRLVEAARAARRGGVTLFTGPDRHTGAAALGASGRIYRAAGADDAAFHYRFAIGGVLQQAATEGDYFVRAVAVEGEPGTWPRVAYRERQYGFEFSSFAVSRGEPPTWLILSDGRGRLKAAPFEAALPKPFSVARFNPEAIEQFLRRQLPSAPHATEPR